MGRNQIIAQFCELANEVNREVFLYDHASDCFCGRAQPHAAAGSFAFDPIIMDFITEAVREAIHCHKVSAEADQREEEYIDLSGADFGDFTSEMIRRVEEISG